MKRKGQKDSTYVQQWTLNKFIQRIDIFGTDLPMFNLKGESKVFTLVGGVFTVIIVCIWLVYATIKFEHMITKHNPLISEVNEQNFFDYETRLNLQQIGFKMAFSIEGYLDSKTKDDERYVKILVRIYGKEEGEEF